MPKRRYLKVDGIIKEYISTTRPKKDRYNRIDCPSCSEKCVNIYCNERGTYKRKIIGFFCSFCNHSYIFDSKPFKVTLEDFDGNKIGYEKDPKKGKK